MALPTLQRKLFENDGYGPKIKDERLSTDITVKDWDASHDYPANVLAKAGGDIYRSVAASGPGTVAGAVNPTQDASAVYWEVFGKGGSVPVGTVIWLSTATVPVGFLLCNGQAVGRTTYPDLFDAIGTTYGVGDGSTTFNLPNLIDKFIEGASTNIGDSVAAGLPEIHGWQNFADFSVLGGNGGALRETRSSDSSGLANLQRTGSTGSYYTVSFNASEYNPIYGNSNTVQPPAVKLLPCIKAYSDVDNLGSLDVAQLENYVQNNCVHKTGTEHVYGDKIFHDVVSHKSYIALYNGDNAGSAGIDFIPGTTSNYAYIWLGANSNFKTPSVLLWANADYATFRPGQDNLIRLGSGERRWTQLYAKTSTISTSDERKKSSIVSIPDEVLDAWGSIDFIQYQFNDSVAEKGASARIHNGLIAQRVDEAFASRGLDASRYALFCHDAWEAQPEKRDENGNVVNPAIEAGDEYSLRYEEALCMEAAYQRRRADRAEARISALEARLAALEAKLNG